MRNKSLKASIIVGNFVHDYVFIYIEEYLIREAEVDQDGGWFVRM